MAQNVSISANAGDLPHSSAMLDIKSDSKGLLIPRMTKSLREQITGAETGLMVFQTDALVGFYYYAGSSAGWLHLAEGVSAMATNSLPKWNGTNLTGSNISDNGTSINLSVKTISSDTIRTNARLKDKTGLVMPVGTVLAYTGSTAPEGWLFCDGSQQLCNKYKELSDLLGTTWGANNGTTFNVPDLRGMFLRGAGANGIQTNYSGGNLGVFQPDQIQGHFHSHQDNGHSHSLPELGLLKDYGAFIAQLQTVSGGNWGEGSNNTNSSSANIVIQNPSSNGTNGSVRFGNETKSVSYSVNYIIKI